MNSLCEVCRQPIPGTVPATERYDGVARAGIQVYVMVHKECIDKWAEEILKARKGAQ